MSVGVLVGVFVGVAVAVLVDVGLGVAVFVDVLVGVPLAVGELVDVGVAVAVAVAVGVFVSVGVLVGVALAVGELVIVGVRVHVGVGVTVGVLVTVGVDVGVGVRVGQPPQAPHDSLHWLTPPLVPHCPFAEHAEHELVAAWVPSLQKQHAASTRSAGALARTSRLEAGRMAASPKRCRVLPMGGRTSRDADVSR